MTVGAGAEGEPECVDGEAQAGPEGYESRQQCRAIRLGQFAHRLQVEGDGLLQECRGPYERRALHGNVEVEADRLPDALAT